MRKNGAWRAQYHAVVHAFGAKLNRDHGTCRVTNDGWEEEWRNALRPLVDQYPEQMKGNAMVNALIPHTDFAVYCVERPSEVARASVENRCACNTARHRPGNAITCNLSQQLPDRPLPNR